MGESNYLLQIKSLSDKLSSYENDMVAFFNNAPVLFVIAEKNGTFTRINKAFIEYLGWTEAEFSSRPWTYYVHPDDMEATLRIAEIMDNEKVLNFTNRYLAKNGEYKSINWLKSKWINDKSYIIAFPLDK